MIEAKVESYCKEDIAYIEAFAKKASCNNRSRFAAETGAGGTCRTGSRKKGKSYCGGRNGCIKTMRGILLLQRVKQSLR